MTATPPPAFPGQTAPPPYPVGGAAQGPKTSVSWTGVLLALGALVAAVGTFLPYEKIVFFYPGGISTSEFNGLGSETRNGRKFVNFEPGNAGKIVLAAGIVALVLGVLILARKGRLWVSILALVVSAAALIMALASLAAPASDQKDLRAIAPDGIDINGLVKMGATLSSVGAGVALLGALLALILRKRQG